MTFCSLFVELKVIEGSHVLSYVMNICLQLTGYNNTFCFCLHPTVLWRFI